MGVSQTKAARLRHMPVSYTVPNAGHIKRVGRVTRARFMEPEQRNALLHEVHAMAQAAMTDYEIAAALGISYWTLSNWQREDPALSEAMILGTQAANARVERSLFHKAIGYTFESEKIMNVDGVVQRIPVTEHVPPDTASIVWWQKNKAGWSDKQDVNLNANVKTDEQTDIRTLAMAILMTIREGMEAAANPVIEHQEKVA